MPNAPSTEEVRVAIADDSSVLVQVLEQVLSDHESLIVACAVTDATSLGIRLAEDPVDVVLLDLRFGDIWGADLIPRLRAGPAAPAVVVYTADVTDVIVAQARGAGASRVVEKGAPLAELRDTILEAARERGARGSGQAG